MATRGPGPLMDYRRNERHIYTGSRAQAGKLVAWLMDKGYWLEVSRERGEYVVTCGIEPEHLRTVRTLDIERAE